MSDKPIPRPPQVMLCGGAIVVGSVLLVLLAFDQMAALGSIEAQEAADDFVSRPPGDGLGISADQVQSLLRALCVVVGGTAVATAGLGWQAMQRQRGARVALSVLAVVLVVAGTPAGSGIAGVSAVVAVAVALLWAQPARDWFAGKTPQRVERAPSRPTPTPTTQPTQATQPTQGSTAYPPPPPGAPGSTLTDTRTPPAHRLPARRPPASVLRAVRLTIVTSSVVAVASLWALLVALNDRASVETEIGDQLADQEMYDGVDVSTVVDLVLVGMGLFALWALAAIVLAVLTLRGNDVARVVLVVSAFCSAAASLLGIALVVPLLIGVVSIAVAVMLLRSEAGDWFAERRRHSGPPS